MTILFSKYSGAGNDFILIDNREKHFSLEGNFASHLICNLCNRFHGIGADGVIFLETSVQADFRMRIFNSDGGEAEMCGNGLRCLGKFIQELGFLKNKFSIETPLSPTKCHFIEISDKNVIIELGLPKQIDQFLLPDLDLAGYFIDSGVPHAVFFVDSVDEIDLKNLGPKIRNHPHFQPRGVNVNFAHLTQESIHLRTFERGVEAETLACGTGAIATAFAATIKFGLNSPISVTVRSKAILIMEFIEQKQGFFKVLMQGPAHRTFLGNFQLEDFLSSK